MSMSLRSHVHIYEATNVLLICFWIKWILKLPKFLTGVDAEGQGRELEEGRRHCKRCLGEERHGSPNLELWTDVVKQTCLHGSKHRSFPHVGGIRFIADEKKSLWAELQKEAHIFKKWHVLLSASLAVRSLYILVSPFSLFSCLLFDSKKAEDT